ncbi:LysR family transcriptional regulator [Burkholderia humptydooensis]|uniref:LysR family transcriptional regulator n=1 Tax=Burkholderia humptydooensis TaxID=430531 RepID=A0A7T2U3D3_9BURK|nr:MULTISPECIES: LysR family transcriptional regulator [Burkholderia]AJY41895.1 bacterial regulatory helix-turn-helix, lysR family protein [Burkholderia sp. 2002721687]QPS44962.1 LysR family transcriptional regulator [Burkholderia humptydooensis]
MNYTGIEAFLAIVQCGGIGRAAEALNLTQSSVSKRLHLLERELRAALIERGRGLRDVRLTEAGEAFLDIAERWSALHHESMTVGGLAERASLRIGSVPAISYELLNDVYRELSETAPFIDVSIYSGQSIELCEKVGQLELDVAFTWQFPRTQRVSVRELYSDRIVGICLPDSPLANRMDVSVSELNAEHEIFFRSDEVFQTWHDSRWGARREGRIAVNTVHLLLALLSRPEQWGLVPYRVSRAASATKMFSSFMIKDEVPHRTTFMLTARHLRRGTAAALNTLEEIVRTKIGALEP